MKRYLAAVIITAMSVYTYKVSAQVTDWATASSLTDQVKEPSPEVAVYGKFADDELSLSTGTGTVAVPLYQIQSGPLSIPVSMSYTLRAFKTDEQSGWLGLGWSLNAGGSISRRIAGLPDEKTDFDLRDAGTLRNENAAEYFREIIANRKDAQRDIFSYSFCGQSGTFVIEDNGDGYDVIQLPKGDLEIECKVDAKCEFDFIITAADGTVYTFDVRETTKYVNTPFAIDVNSPGHSYEAVTAWFLSSISAPQDQETAYFQYVTAPEWSQGHGRSSERYTITSTNGYAWNLATGDSQASISGTNQSYFKNQRILSKIQTRTTTIDFLTEDIDAPAGYKGSPMRISGMSVRSTMGYNTVREVEFTASIENKSNKLFLTDINISADGETIDSRHFNYRHLGANLVGDVFGYPNYPLYPDDPEGTGGGRGTGEDLKDPDDGGGVYKPITEESGPYNPGTGGGGMTIIPWPADTTETFPNLPYNVIKEDGTFNPRRKPREQFVQDGVMIGWSNAMGIEVEYTYEPSQIMLADSVHTAKVGVRLAEIAVTDRSSGRERRRKFTYHDPVSSIDFNEVGIEPFVALSGTVYSDGNIQYTTTVVLADGSRVPGHPIEGATIYYGRVTESVSGTDIDYPLRTDYEFDTSRCKLKRDAKNDYGPVNHPDFPRTVRDFRDWSISPDKHVDTWLFRVSPVNYYYREEYVQKAPMMKATTYRVTESGKYVPETVKRYRNTIFSETEHITGVHHEVLIRSNSNHLGRYDFKGCEDFVFCNTTVYAANTLCDLMTTTRYYENGDSTVMTQRTHYDRLYAPDMQDYTKVERNPLLSAAHTVITDSLHKFEGDTSSISYRQGRAAMVPTAVTSEAGGHKVVQRYYTSLERDIYGGKTPDRSAILPVEDQTIVDGCDTLRRQYSYAEFSGVWLPVAITQRHNSNPECDRIDIYGYDAWRHPTDVQRRGQARKIYEWDINDMLLSSKIAGTDIITRYESTPLVGYTKITAPHGGKRTYTYHAGRLTGEAINDGTKVAQYEYELESEHQYLSGNRIKVSTLGGDASAGFGLIERVFDGFGEETGSVSVGYGGDGSDVSVFAELDAVGRPVRQWMPLVIDEVAIPRSEQLTAASQSLYGDAFGVTTTDYRGYRDDGETSTRQAGELMQEFPATTTTRLNTAGGLYGCLRYSIEGGRLVCHGNYPAGALVVTVACDPESKVMLSFTDMLGRKVLERRCEGDISYPGTMADTYYVNDSFGTPVVVLQPMAQESLGKAGSWSIDTDADIDRYAFVYGYDARRQLRALRVPGADAVQTVYDSEGRPVFRRDGNMRARDKRLYMLYDAAGRVAEEGVCDDVADESFWQTAEPAAVTAVREDSTYTAAAALVNRKAYKVYYYDDYSMSGTAVVPLGAIATPKGLATGTRTAVFTADNPYTPAGYNMSVNYYDADGNVIRTGNTDFRGNVYRADMSYTPAGKLSRLSEMLTHGDNIYTASQSTGYDCHGRMTGQRAQLGEGAEVACADYEYNTLGQLAKTAVPGYEVERTYNIRGALRSISSPVYQETLWYEDGMNSSNLTGRISERDFHVYGDRYRSYQYTYDGMGRLIHTNSRDDQEHSWGRFMLLWEFDRNSNITRIIRNGVLARDVYGVIDDAEISYDGNRLQSVTDNAAPVNLETSMDIPSGEFGEGSFDYDANGNLTADMTRNITEIIYSPTNNPLRISFGDGRSIDYVYSADGVKLEATEPSRLMTPVEEPIPLIPGGKQKSAEKLPVMMDRRSYTGSFELRNGGLSRYNVATGYFDSKGKYYSSVADYQGNIVAVTSADGEGSFDIYQRNVYYPDGMPYAAEAMINGGAKPELSLLEANRYKYSGKELTTTFGANFYDFEARMRFIGLPMFGSIDPKATEMPWISPYLFCMGNPIDFIDKDGEKPTYYEAALMADAAYKENITTAQLPKELQNSGWSVSDFNTSIKMNYTKFYQNGLQSVLFEKTTDGVTEYVYAYAGTNSVEDAAQDYMQLCGLSNQYMTAVYNAKTLSQELGNKELTFVGHSLGGGEAAAASMATGRKAITFNPAAVSICTRILLNLGSSENITNFRTSPKKGFIGGCAINNFQNNVGIRAPGRTYKIPVDFKDPFRAHKMKIIIQYGKEVFHKLDNTETKTNSK